MALIKCPECKKDISDKATACIHCGYPIVNIQQEILNTVQLQSHSEIKETVDDTSLGFTLFSLDDNNVNLECNKCSKVYKYDKKVYFSQVSDKKCILHKDISCPNCGNKDHDKLNVARRTCGYIGTNFWNKGRTQEIKERVLHLDNKDA